MRGIRAPGFLAGAGLVLVSAGYGIWGAIAGARLAVGAADAGAERIDAALSRLAGAAWGADAFEAAWLRGGVRLGIWDQGPESGRGPEQRRELLEQAAADFHVAYGVAPGSGRAIAGLADTYQRAEDEAADERVLDLAALDAGPWAQIGREGRIALGLRELAVEWERNVATRQSKRVRALVEAGCKAEADAAMVEAAQVLPCFELHKGFTLDTISRPLVETFARASRAALGTTPLLRHHRHLLCLAQLERGLGRYETAYADLSAAAAEPLGAEDRAEVQYWLGLAAADVGRTDEALAAFGRASEFPSFRLGSAIERARVLRSKGRVREALDAMTEARRVAPRDPGVLVTYAQAAVAAGDTAAALEALRWAVLVRPDATNAWTMLVETLLSAGETGEAASAVEGMARALGESNKTRRLRARLNASP